MTETLLSPEEYAQQFKFDLDVYDLMSPRSKHADEGGIGASSFGCREEMRFILTKHPRTDSPDMTAAQIGSYVDAGVKAARKALNPHLIVDAELTVTLPNGFSFPVHPDEIDPTEPSVTDLKTKDGLAAIRRGFADDHYRIQRHLQYLAAYQAGIVPPEGVARNVYLDRSGKDPRPHVEQEPFSTAVIEEATAFSDDVLYAIANGERASQDKPRTFCKDWCPFFSACRAGEIADEGPITDPQIARVADAYGDAWKQAQEAKQLMDELKDMGVRGLIGHTDRYRIVSTWINNAKSPHYRVDVEAL